MWVNGQVVEPKEVTAIPESLSECEVTAVAAGGGHTMILTADGRLHGAGSNLYGQVSRLGEFGYIWGPKGPKKIDLFPVCARVEFYFSAPGREFFLINFFLYIVDFASLFDEKSFSPTYGYIHGWFQDKRTHHLHHSVKENFQILHEGGKK